MPMPRSPGSRPLPRSPKARSTTTSPRSRTCSITCSPSSGPSFSSSFASVLPKENYFRFVHRDDWVACVPPLFLGYQHAGKLRAVTGSPPRRFWDDVTSAAAGFASAMTAMANELRVRVGDLPFKIAGIADHAPIYYATLLWNELLAESMDSTRLARAEELRWPVSLDSGQKRG